MTSNTPIVIENGPGAIKSGFANETTPSVIIPNTVTLADGSTVNAFEQGCVANWEGVQQIWSQIFSRLRVDPSAQPVLLTERAQIRKADRQKITQIMFETFKVPALYVANNASLALYQSGRTTGVVVHMGYDVLHVVPIFEGMALLHAIIHMDLSKSALRNCPEACYDPTLIGIESAGVHETIYNSIRKCDIDIRKALYENIVLAGEASFLPEIETRMQREVAMLAPGNEQINCIAPADREHSVWLGGAKLTTLLTVDHWITPAEYAQSGTNIVNLKCV